MNIDLDNLDSTVDRRKLDRLVSVILLAACLFDLAADVGIILLIVLALR